MDGADRESSDRGQEPKEERGVARGKAAVPSVRRRDRRAVRQHSVRAARRAWQDRRDAAAPASGFASGSSSPRKPSAAVSSCPPAAAMRSRRWSASVWAAVVTAWRTSTGAAGIAPSSISIRRFISSMPPAIFITSICDSPSSAASASSCLAANVVRRLSSIVCSVTSTYTCTGRFWPMRWAREIRCSSTAGFQGKSTLMTVLAAWRFRSVAPALVVRKSRQSSSHWKALTSCCRFFCGTEPSSRT